MAPVGGGGEEAAHKRKKKGHGRRRLPADLPRKRMEHEPSEEEKVCEQCGKEKTRIGEENSEQLEYVPASLYVIEHVRGKYACKGLRMRSHDWGEADAAD